LKDLEAFLGHFFECVFLRDASISLLGPPGHADSVSFLDPGDNSIVDGKASVKKKDLRKTTLSSYINGWT